MILQSLRLLPILFIHRSIPNFYFALKRYLPRKRFKEFVNSWGLSNLIRGPKKRRKLEKKWACRLPSNIVISSTFNCNLKCRGCYSSSHDRHEEMPVDKVERIIAEAKKIGAYSINLLGGEPLLRKDILPVFQKNKDMAFRISTNGTLIDDEVVEVLKASGNAALFFSLEGFEEQTDYWRGEGVFQQIRENMLRLKQERILFGFSVTLHAKNKDVLISEEFLDLMENLGNKMGLFVPYGPTGENQYLDLVIEENQLKKTFEKLESLEEKYSMLFEAEGYVSSKKPPAYFLNRGCQAGRNVHIIPDGRVEPCNGIQFHTENIFEKSLLEILTSPFYRDIFSCVRENVGRCVPIYEPMKILEIIRKHNAVGSNAKSLANLRRHSGITEEKQEA